MHTKHPCDDRDWFVQNMCCTQTNTRVITQKRTGMFPHTHIHTHTRTNRTDEEQAQLFPPAWPSCYTVILPREKLICLLMQQILSAFWRFFRKCCLHALTCCSAVINKTCTHTHTVCMHTATSHLTITQHTAGFFLPFAASKLDGLPYIFSYADGHITGAGIPLK